MHPSGFAGARAHPPAEYRVLNPATRGDHNVYGAPQQSTASSAQEEPEYASAPLQFLPPADTDPSLQQDALEAR